MYQLLATKPSEPNRKTGPRKPGSPQITSNPIKSIIPIPSPARAHFPYSRVRNQIRTENELGFWLLISTHVVWPGPSAAFPSVAVRGKLSAAGSGKAKRMKVVKHRVPQDFIDYMIATPSPILTERSEDELAKEGKPFRDTYAIHKVRNDKIKAYFRALLDQYEAQGYAEDESEVTDEEEEAAVVSKDAPIRGRGQGS